MKHKIVRRGRLVGLTAAVALTGAAALVVSGQGPFAETASAHTPAPQHVSYPQATPRVPQALQDTPYAKLPQVPAFKVTSTDVATGEEMAKTYRSDTGGGNTSPELSWSGFPEGTKSFVVSMYDQDAPTGSGFWHWEVYNLPASTTSLPTGAGAVKSTTLPSGAVQGTNDAGIAGYLGAAPPAGQKHRYFITVSALNVAKLDLPATASPAFVNFNIFGHTIGRGTLVPLAATPAG